MRKICISALAALLFVTACSGDDDQPLPGKRISVLSRNTELSASPDLTATKIKLPNQSENIIWTMQNIAPVIHPAFSGNPELMTEVSVGEEPEERMKLTSTPVIANSLIYTLDGAGNLAARDVNNPRKIAWVVSLETKEISREFAGIKMGAKKRAFLGGNISFARSALFVTTWRGEVMAFGATDGKLLWQRKFDVPIKSSPIVHQRGIVFFITSDNNIYALDSRTGETRWKHEGISETTSVFGSPSPVIKDHMVLVPYSSGEIYALNIDTGDVIWSENLVGGGRRISSGITLNDINATPVIRGDVVFVAGYDGVLSAIDIKTGKKKWVQNLSIQKTPWIAGDFLFLITQNQELLCVNTKKGDIKWIANLPKRAESTWGDGDRITWNIPVLAGGKLLMAGSNGKMLIISPLDGSIEKEISIPEEVYLPPIIANNFAYILSNKAVLAVYK